VTFDIKLWVWRFRCLGGYRHWIS